MKHGKLCLSGLLITDEETVMQRLEAYPVSVTDKQTEDEWMLLQVEKLDQQESLWEKIAY